MADAYDVSRDQYSASINPGPHFPGRRGFKVTPDDNKDLPSSSGTALYAKALYIGASGDVAVIAADDKVGTVVIFVAHPIGYLPLQVRRVLNTGTTASSIVALTD